jgi:hypothetical protein
MVEIGWRSDLKRKLIWLLAIKFTALALLAYLFFSPSQRPRIDPARAAEHIAVQP